MASRASVASKKAFYLYRYGTVFVLVSYALKKHSRLPISSLVTVSSSHFLVYLLSAINHETANVLLILGMQNHTKPKPF